MNLKTRHTDAAGVSEPLRNKAWAKVTAAALVLVLLCLSGASLFAACLMADYGIYTHSEEATRRSAFENRSAELAAQALHDVRHGRPDDVPLLLNDGNAGMDILWPGEGGEEARFGPDVSGLETELVYSFYFRADPRPGTEGFDEPVDSSHASESDIIRVNVTIDPSLPQPDFFHWADLLISTAYALRYLIYVILTSSLLLAVACFVFLMRAAGHRRGDDEIHPCFTTAIPGDLLLALCAIGGFLVLALLVDTLYRFGLFEIVICAIGGAALFFLFLAWCMDLAIRIKLGTLWCNTLVFRAGKLLWRALRAVGAWLATVLRGIPLVGKTAALCAILMGLQLLPPLFGAYGPSLLLLYFFLDLLLFPLILSAALMMRKLQQGARALAAGDLGYQVDTKHLLWDFRAHGEALNHIGEGMAAAVEQRTRSERMKTELITNVSHDIKTPLTSIINYSDLIGKESCDNETVRDYAEVLQRQSARLKRLLEDLVEASKASTGNLEVVLAPCEAGVMLTQACGEYEERLAQARLKLVTRQPETPVRIQADGRRLWRVFDNLMNNICKYSQSGTRVYITLEETQKDAVISFKNTSREALDLSPDELMERFVRGDAARTSEGSGLGLSIAKSLTELQGGTFELTVDGDFFKVLLRFPKL